MAWIKKNVDVEVSKELEYSSNRVQATNAYEAEVTEAYLQNSAQEGSKAVSLVVNIKTNEDEEAKTFFTVLGRDGNEYFMGTVAGKPVKKQHFGLSIANSLFQIALGKEIFDCEPSDTTYQKWNKDTKVLEKTKADGFPELVGKKVGVCIQMVRKISGKDSSEYPEISHFFDIETGLFATEEESPKHKLDRWLASAKDFKVIEDEAPKSAFGNKSTAGSEEAPKKRKWGK